MCSIACVCPLPRLHVICVKNDDCVMVWSGELQALAESLRQLEKQSDEQSEQYRMIRQQDKERLQVRVRVRG